MQKSAGLFAGLREIAAQLLGSVRDRVELFSVEFQQEKLRLIQLLIWVLTVAVTGMLALLFLSVTLVCVFWDSGRLIALGLLTGLYVVAFGGALVYLRRLVAHQPRPFDGTIEELTGDRTCIRKSN